MSQKLIVVVAGATGKQGGAVVKSLLERGHDVRAVTRSTDSAVSFLTSPSTTSRRGRRHRIGTRSSKAKNHVIHCIDLIAS